MFMLIVTGVHFEFMLASINKSINLHLLKILYLFRSSTVMKSFCGEKQIVV